MVYVYPNHQYQIIFDQTNHGLTAVSKNGLNLSGLTGISNSSTVKIDVLPDKLQLSKDKNYSFNGTSCFNLHDSMEI